MLFQKYNFTFFIEIIVVFLCTGINTLTGIDTNVNAGRVNVLSG
jgi:hypothetical protein